MLHDVLDPEQTVHIQSTETPGVIELRVAGLRSVTVDLRAEDLINEVRSIQFDSLLKEARQ